MTVAEIAPRLASGAANTLYDNAFFSQVDRDGLTSAGVIVPLVSHLIPFNSVVDVGCGHGAWLRVFQDHGASCVVGLDGPYVNRSQLLIPPESFVETDLARPFRIPGKYDLAVCLEVGEHLPRRMAPVLVEALCRAAEVVLFSAAIPGQGGTHHINEQWPRFWESAFKANGFIRLDPIRPQVWRHPDVAPWYKQNIYLFADRRRCDEDKRLRSELEVSEHSRFFLLQEDIVEHHMGLRGLLQALPRAAWRAIRRFA